MKKNINIGAKMLRAFGLVMVMWLAGMSMNAAYAREAAPVDDSAQIMQAFDKQHQEVEHAKSITDKDKQRIMFLLGITLLVLLLTAGGLGIAMGVYGKQVFVPHMIFASLSLTLAVVHAIVGIVWFYPF